MGMREHGGSAKQLLGWSLSAYLGVWLDWKVSNKGEAFEDF